MENIILKILRNFKGHVLKCTFYPVQRPSSETIRRSLRLLTSSASRLQCECQKASPHDSQQVIQCAYDIAKAAKQLVTVTTKDSNWITSRRLLLIMSNVISCSFMSVLLVMCCVPSCDTVWFAFIASINASFQLSGHNALKINGIFLVVNFLMKLIFLLPMVLITEQNVCVACVCVQAELGR